MSNFAVVPGNAASAILAESRKEILRIVADTYEAHDRGQSVNPDSYFLRFPKKPNSRVIALPSYLGGEVDTIGIKWIASFPDNIRRGLPRASATLILNDYATGRPLACLEAANISAARTAASAAVAASELLPRTGAEQRVRASFVGSGVIASSILDYLDAAEVQVEDVLVHDLDSTRAAHLVSHASDDLGIPAVTGTLGEALTRDLVVFATTAATPYVPPTTQLRPGQLLLNISLRDLAPELLLDANNVLDDVDHCLKAETSPHLAERLTGNRDFVTGTLGALLRGEAVRDFRFDPAKPTIFSPFGLGVLDLAVGDHVLREALGRGTAVEIPDF